MLYFFQDSFSQITFTSQHGAHSWTILPKSCFPQAAVLGKGGPELPRDTDQGKPSWASASRETLLQQLLLFYLGAFLAPFPVSSELNCTPREGGWVGLPSGGLPLRSQLVHRPYEWVFPLGFSLAARAAGCPMGLFEWFHNYSCPKYSNFFLYHLFYGCNNMETSNQGPVSNNKMSVWLSS